MKDQKRHAPRMSQLPGWLQRQMTGAQGLTPPLPSGLQPQPYIPREVKGWGYQYVLGMGQGKGADLSVPSVPQGSFLEPTQAMWKLIKKGLCLFSESHLEPFICSHLDSHWGAGFPWKPEVFI